MSSIRIRSRALLLAGVSVVALAVASPELARAADAPPPVIAKAPPGAAPGPQWEWFLEGAGFQAAGDYLHFFRFDPDNEFGIGRRFRARTGWEIAAGFDYHFTGSPWHVAAQLRYGQASDRSFNFRNDPPLGYPTIASGEHGERHWAADFSVGRELGIGAALGQLKLGVRVAELNARTDAAGTINFGSIPHLFSIRQRSKFLGIGPRVALDGAIPAGGAWHFDYGLGFAVLFGNRTLNDSGSVVGGGGGPISVRSSGSGGVFNLDAMAGVSYWFTPNYKLTAGYRFDGYWNALRTVDSNGAITNADRFFHGPFVRATGKF